MALEGYCTAEDVRKALQERGLDGDGQGPLSKPIVDAAIAGQTDWIRRETKRHWYDPNADSDSDTSNDILPSSPRSITEENGDIPSSPHAGHAQLAVDDNVRYPVTQGGGYAEIRLGFKDIESVTKLLVREKGRDYTDWVADSGIVQGRGEDYYLESDPETDITDLYIDTRALAPRQDWTNTVVVDFDYGTSPIPETIRRAQAALAGADLVMDDDVKTAIPNDGQLIAVETKADRLIKQAMRLLEPYR